MFPAQTKILVVDDMSTMRKIVKKTLKNFGFSDITEADDGQTAWPKLETALEDGKPFQLVVSDWNMHGLTGIQLLKKVRGHVQMAKLPFILLTAEAEKDNIVQAINAGVSAFIVKPFQAVQLKEKLAQVHKAVSK